MLYNTMPIFGDGQNDFKLVAIETSDLYKTLAVCGNILSSTVMIEQWNIQVPSRMWGKYFYAAETAFTLQDCQVIDA